MLNRAPEFGEHVRAGRRAERRYGTADTTNFCRRLYGPGWAIVGDAEYHKDRILAQGITDAFRVADLSAEAVDGASLVACLSRTVWRHTSGSAMRAHCRATRRTAPQHLSYRRHWKS